MSKTQDFSVKVMLFVLLFCTMTLQTQAFLWWDKDKEDIQEEMTGKQVIVGETLPFSVEDFKDLDKLASITIQTLPHNQFGMLMLKDGQVLQSQQVLSVTALPTMLFQSKSTLGKTEFSYIPSYFDGSSGDVATISIEVVDKPNEAPVAHDMDLFTYKNIEITCYFDVTDPESDYLTFQIVDPPARGSVTISEHGSSSFLYTPYENKVGKDEFSYIVTDSSGNVSNEAVVKMQIEKADTPVIYGDMKGHSAHKSAVSLAEAGIFVGECVGETYLFHPDTEVTREEFLSLAMAVAKLEPLEEMTTTGFYDDESISTWSKSYVSAALLSGVIHGTNDEKGRAVFQGDSVVTLGEASVILDNLLNISPVTDVSGQHWASQASANLTAVGVTSHTPLPASMNRGEVAELLDGALALVKEKEDNWLTW